MRLLIKCIEKNAVVSGDGSELKSAAAPLSVETSGRMIRKRSKQSLQITPKPSHVCITVPLKLRCRVIENHLSHDKCTYMFFVLVFKVHSQFCI